MRVSGLPQRMMLAAAAVVVAMVASGAVVVVATALGTQAEGAAAVQALGVVPGAYAGRVVVADTAEALLAYAHAHRVALVFFYAQWCRFSKVREYDRDEGGGDDDMMRRCGGGGGHDHADHEPMTRMMMMMMMMMTTTTMMMMMMVFSLRRMNMSPIVMTMNLNR
jgi:hypothetical protein